MRLLEALVASVVLVVVFGVLYLLSFFGIRFFKGGSQWSDDSPWHL